LGVLLAGFGLALVELVELLELVEVVLLFNEMGTCAQLFSFEANLVFLTLFLEPCAV